MSWRRPLYLLLALAASCGGGAPIPAHDLRLAITADVAQVQLGRAFSLTVVRTWSHDVVPVPWSDEALAPLAVKLVETKRREDDRRVEETRRYRGYAFSLGDLTVPAAVMQASPRRGGTVREARGNALKLRVQRAIRTDEPGPPELPDGPLSAPVPWPWILAGAIAVFALVLWGVRRKPAPVEPPAVEPAPPGPHELALAALARLQSDDPALYVEATRIVRDYVGARYGVRTREKTTEELLAALPHDRLAAVLHHGDLVKFARQPPEPERVLGDAEAYIRETAA